MVTKLIANLAAKFSLKDLGHLNYFLDVEVISPSSGIFLSQRKYIQDVLQKVGMLTAKPNKYTAIWEHSIATQWRTSATFSDGVPTNHRELTIPQFNKT
ncbi:hypothetical protein V2J09_011371 [Rumex salicifolius]